MAAARGISPEEDLGKASQLLLFPLRAYAHFKALNGYHQKFHNFTKIAPEMVYLIFCS